LSKINDFLIIGFNRSDLLEQQVERILTFRNTARIYICIDGPRQNNQSDGIQNEKIRTYLNKHKNNNSIKNIHFSDQNKGCRTGVLFAITWFFKQVDVGVILEDDIEYDIRFLEFCDLNISKIIDGDNVFALGGSNFVPMKRNGQNLIKTHYPHIWGWATTKRCWQDFLEASLTKTMIDNLIKKAINKISILEFFYFNRKWRALQNNKIDTWDYLISAYCIANNLYYLIPPKNLVKNIGFYTGVHDFKNIKNFTNSIDKDTFTNAIASAKQSRRYEKKLIFSKYLSFIKETLGMI